MTRKTKQISLGVMAAALTIAIPVVTAVSCGKNNRDFATYYRFKRTEINKYGTLAPLPQRTFDSQFISGNAVTDDGSSSGRTLPLLRTKATGLNKAKVNSDLKNVDPKKQITWETSQKEEVEFQGAESIKGSIDGTNWTEIKPTDIVNGATKVEYKFYKFKIRDTKWTTYKNKASQYTLNAKDYFYGMMRSLAASKPVRENGTLNGKKIPGLPQFSSLSGLDANDKSLNNTNGYLLDLFGVDVEKTIADGEKLTKDDREFTVSLTKPSGMILDSLFANNSYFSPVPSTKIDEMAKGSSKPEVKYGITTYGKDGSQLSGVKDILSVSPYFYTSYSFLNGYTIVKNNHYWDKNFVNDKTRITKYTYHVTPEGADPQAEALARKTGYENGLESIFDAKAWKNPDIQLQIRANADKYGATLSKVFKVGLQNKLLWNPTLPKSLAGAYNAKGMEAMYGKGMTTRDKVLKNPSALNEFYNGNGMKLRKAMDAAYNWYAGSVAASGTTQKLALLSPLAPEQKTTEGGKTVWELLEKNNANPRPATDKVDDSIWAKPTIAPSYIEMKNQYNSHGDSEFESAKSPAFDIAKKILNEVASNIGATSSDPAYIPLQTWGAADKGKDSSEMVKQWSTMIKVFNEASGGAIKFKRVVPPTWSTHLNAFQHNEAEFQYAAWSPDYPAASSSLQGIVGIERTGIIVGQMLDAAKQPELKQLMGKYKIDENVVKTITTEDIYKMSQNQTSDFSADKKELMNAAQAMTSKGYLEKATDNKFMTEVVAYLQDHAVYYRPIISKYTSLIPNRETGGATIVVVKKWLHKRTLKNGTEFLQDYSVDLD
ncbi:OppA family ABC transporter substrate-binding lipoprotein [Mycoplasma todarodis]|uniref:OppA family ABC transporter substrate-binding lipoprotein n=1 Tax=Mycoplasma todarodis TaxID=1937191 RepID=UPI003B340A57